MENYSRARVVEQPSVCPFSVSSDTPELRVKHGSKIRNLLRFALSRMDADPRPAEEGEGAQPEGGSQQGQQEAPGRPPCTQMVFTSTGKGVSKAITCAEMVKRRVKGLHQLTRLTYSTVLEVWEPREPTAGLDSLTVSRNLPTVWILLSREPLDHSQPGYQAPGRYDALWAQAAVREEGGGRAGPRRKRGGGGGSRGKGPGRQPGRSRDSTKGQT
ncbi:ribonuclease P protein subunit p25-like protein [Austrofundulus limnaeus]|uniref:Ribonuclease P protein subunit p25-like protein n=1 Tax=Austrofundulus limnaeus TaxID=52670 RepID=A0A2I4CCE5_AUSLI|nr:PREDICTED: ribonuclease P protein subunit p25-like protein [Austrofundulus limnaeus]